MEEERNKKKKNRKKKNKQTSKTIETIHVEGSASIGQSHIAEAERSRNDIVEDSITDKDELRSNDTDGATYEEKIKELKAENDAQIQKEAILEEKIKQLLEEKEKHANIRAADMKELKQLNEYNSKLVQNEAVLREKLVQLQKEKDDLVQKMMLKEQTVQQLETEKTTHLQKVATLEMSILQLEGERNTWLQKEASFQQNINEMEQEKDLWISKEASLETKLLQLEGERDSSTQKHALLQESINEMERERESLIYELNSAKESIARTEDENTNLRAKVLELEQSKGTLLEETVRLSETISNLQLETKNLEKTASSTSDKLITEDGNQIEASHGATETGNQLYDELGRRNVVVTDDVPVPSSSVAQTSVDSQVQANENHEAESSANSTTELASKALQVPESTHRPLVDIIITEDGEANGGPTKDDVDNPGIITSSSEIVEVDEITQIPLEENNGAREIITQVTQGKEESNVPITDAPMIGAPFRFMSFIARYVSGEDLVGKNTAKS